MHDGDQVAFVGYPGSGRPAIGDRGTLMNRMGESANVHWKTGALAGQYAPVSLGDLEKVVRVARGPQTVSEDLDDSLDVGVVKRPSLRYLCALEGAGAVLQMLAAQGQTSGLAAIAEDLRVLAERAIREDEHIKRVAGELDPEDADELIKAAACTTLHDAASLWS